MTVVHGTQVLDDRDEELIRQLVPPRHSRWKIGFLLAIVAALLAGVIVAGATGFPAPRLALWMDSVRADGDKATITLHVRNTGRFPGTIESVRLDGGLIDASSVARPDVTVEHGHDATVAVRINASFAFKCDTTIDPTSSVRTLHAKVKMRNSLGMVTTRSYKIDAVKVAMRHGKPVLGFFYNWPTAATNASCGNYDS
ncbi:MAG TPA: hypothetical protein VL856_16345 [Acidimicrobiia bacterium]|jgi:hypothetical protein|nr:hypothetical protein [Acidimicrobiia bacterium]